MQVVLLAAGRGERLMPLTAEQPKATVEVAGVALVERALAALKKAGLTEVVAITGHFADRLNDYPVEAIFNERFGDANNIYSLWKARDVVASGCYIVNCDVLFADAVAELLATQSGTAILCDDSRPADEEAMKAVTEQGRLTELSKDASLDRNQGEYIGLARIDSKHGPRLAEILDSFIEAGHVDVYYEDAIETLARELPVEVVSTGALAWAEIDDHRDLEYAEREVIGRLNSVY